MNLGIIGYVPPRGILNSESFMANLGRFKTEYPLYLYSDDPSWAPTCIIPNPELIGKRPRWAINNLIWFRGLKLAIELALSHFIYIESDSRVGCDQWDKRMFDEYFGWRDNRIICAGTPVCWDMCSGGRTFAMSIIEDAFAYQKASGLPMTFFSGKHPFDTSGAILYPNGSLSILDTAALAKLFAGFDTDIVSSARFLTAFDMELGRRLWYNFSTETIYKVGWIACSYSGYGSAICTERELLAMLADGSKVAVHPIKSNYDLV